MKDSYRCHCSLWLSAFSVEFLRLIESVDVRRRRQFWDVARWPPILRSNDTGPKNRQVEAFPFVLEGLKQARLLETFLWWYGDALAILASVSDVSYKKHQRVLQFLRFWMKFQTCQVVFLWIPRPSPSCSRLVNGNRRAISVAKREILVKHVKSLEEHYLSSHSHVDPIKALCDWCVDTTIRVRWFFSFQMTSACGK